MSYARSIQDMIDDFSFLDDWEDRYMHVIEMGKALPPMAEKDKTPKSKVKGCVSQVWLKVDAQDGKLYFRGDSDAHIVKGLVAIAFIIFSGRSAKDIIDIDALAILEKLGLTEHLSPQRSNGLHAMIARIKQEAQALSAV